MVRRLIPFRFYLAGCSLAGLWAAAAPSRQAAGPDLNVFLDKIQAKVSDFQETRNWRASVTVRTSKMDRHWTPEAITVVIKTITVKDGRRSEEVHQVLETKDGKTRDITQAWIENDRKEHEKYRRQRAPEKPRPAGAPPRKRGLNASIEEYSPFSAARRNQFTFRVDENAVFDGRLAVALDVKAKVKSEKNWEGRVYFEPETLNPLRVEAKPSETPRFVKELETRVTLDLVNGRNLMLKNSWIKVNAGFLFIKRIRQIAEEVYTGVEVFDQ